MKKYKKIITGLILGLICAILPFVGVAKVKAITAEDEVNTLNDLIGTSWDFNSTVSDITFNSAIYANNIDINLGTYQEGENSVDVLRIAFTANSNSNQEIANSLTLNVNNENYTIIKNNVFLEPFGASPRRFTFNPEASSINDFYGSSLFLNWLKENADLYNEPTTRTIPFKISLITNVFGDELEYINSSLINLPVFDDTVSFTVSFENNKMINGQINHPESADELGELTFSNGERVFYTIYYNETNIEFKLYFYGDQLFLYEAVMYNTEVLDSGGNYQATVATYSEGISEQEMETLKNSGIYEASFDITIPQEAELVTDAQLMLEIGILEGSEPPGFDNITNIMTGIFTLVSSFLSIQLGFITLGQIIGLILAIGVIFFIFYVWNGGRNGN